MNHIITPAAGLSDTNMELICKDILTLANFHFSLCRGMQTEIIAPLVWINVLALTSECPVFLCGDGFGVKTHYC